MPLIFQCLPLDPSVPHSQDLLECLPELWIEYGVDERVDAAVDVAQPGGEHEGRVPRAPGQVELDADGVEDVASKEGDPAHKETAWRGRFGFLLSNNIKKGK